MTRTPRWLVAVALAALALIADLLVVRQEPAAQLVVEMQSSEASQAKVFFDTGVGFNEIESAVHSVAGDSTVHRLAFPLPGKPVRSIRFDPLEISGVVAIRSVVIERPRSHDRLAELDAAKIIPLNEIRSLALGSGAVQTAIVENARDPQLLLPVEKPLEFRHSAKELVSRHNLRVTAVLLLLAACAAGVIFAHRRLSGPILAVNRVLDRWRSPGGVIAFDRGAFWFYGICLAAFLILTCGKFHGSSMSIAGGSYLGWIDATHMPLLGTPKKVRSDEWSFHTPTILNQLYRKEQLSVNDSLLGPGKAALLGNIPCWHFTQLFRPQFWPFFVLPADFAFAAYWQAKALLLLTGLFTLMFLLTRSGPIAAVCALWYFFSAYTQWGYSWASLLPEMVGLFCWTISLTCYLTIGRNRTCLFLAAIVCAACAINFALCAYPPHQVPLAIFGAAIVAGWLLYNWNAFRRGPGLTTRLLCLTGCWVLLVGGVLIWFYSDARETIMAAANTVYPGQRSSSGGGISAAQFISHFVDFWKREDNFPALQGNICEASGYLWLAPATLLISRPARRLRVSGAILVLSWAAALVLLAWMVLPVPATVGSWLGLNRVPPFRCYHALGLINVAIVGMCLAEQERLQHIPHLVRRYWVQIAGGAALLGWLLFRMNRSLGYFFPTWTLWAATAYAGLLMVFLFRARVKVFAACLLVPLVLANGLINPIDRGLGVLTNSSLFKAVHETHKEWRDHQWLIYAPWAAEPGVLAATGINVVSCLKIIPDRERLAHFDPDGQYNDIINRSSYFFALPVSTVEAGSFEAPSLGNVLWRVSPLDPRLRQIDVTHIVAAYQPLPKEIASQIAPDLEVTLPGLQVYRVR